MNAQLDLFTAAPVATDPIVVDWRRFECGLWGYSKGDIAGSYCADKLPKLRGTFQHQGRSYVATGLGGGSRTPHEARCHELIPAVPGITQPYKVEYSSEGRLCAKANKHFILGPEVHFQATYRTIEEYRDFLYRLYSAAGGYAAGFDYLGWLSHELEEQYPDLPNMRYADAIRLELEQAANFDNSANYGPLHPIPLVFQACMGGDAYLPDDPWIAGLQPMEA